MLKELEALLSPFTSKMKKYSLTGSSPPKKALFPESCGGDSAASLLVSAFLLVNGWAQTPSVSEKTTYFKVGPRPIDLLYGEGSEGLKARK